MTGARPGRAPGAARALWIVLAALVLARAVLAFTPTMSWWGLNHLRFVPPVAGWTLWTLAALALIPAVARLALPALERLGDAPARRLALTCVAWAAAAAATVWCFPDRLRFVGDYLLRFGTAERALQPAALFPQALPLDVLLHYSLPRLLGAAFGLDVNDGARLLGALEAGLLGALAVGFARALDLRGAAAAAASAVVLCGGYLAMFTGYGKAIAEVTLLTAGLAVAGLRVLRGRGGLLAPGLCVAIGLVLHRSTLGLVPALVLCWVHALRQQGRALVARPTTWIAAAVPLAALALMLPRIATTFAGMDAVHFTPPEVQRQGGVLGAMFAGARPADLLGVVTLLSPVALAAPGMAAFVGRGRDGLLLLSLALPWLAMLLLIHPPQGMFRDWDNFTAAAMTLSLLSAWLVARVVNEAPRWAWLAVPVTLAALTPTLQWLIHEADLERGLGRVEAYLREPPPRLEEERAKTWDFLGIRYAQLGRWGHSAEALKQAVEYSPSPRVVLQLASALQASGDDAGAQVAYRYLLSIAPAEARGWYGLAFVSLRRGDWAEARRAARELLRLRPGDEQALEMLKYTEGRDTTGGEETR